MYRGSGKDDIDAHKARQPAVREIGVLLFAGFSLFGVSIIPEIFELANEINANRKEGGRLYNVTFLSGKGAGIHCSSSVSVWTRACTAYNIAEFEALFIADGPGADQAIFDNRLVNWLSKAVPASAVITPIGNGRLLLEAATAGKPSREQLEEMLRKRDVSANADTLSDSGDSIEPAQSALMIVRRDLGAEVTREISIRISSRGGALASLFHETHGDSTADKVRAAAHWLKENCDRAISVREAGKIASMSERNFLRYFKREIGLTPSEYLLQARLDMTTRLLLETTMSVDSIAKRCGWASGDRLAKAFRRRYASTPSEYRTLRAAEEIRP